MSETLVGFACLVVGGVIGLGVGVQIQGATTAEAAKERELDAKTYESLYAECFDARAALLADLAACGCVGPPHSHEDLER